MTFRKHAIDSCWSLVVASFEPRTEAVRWNEEASLLGVFDIDKTGPTLYGNLTRPYGICLAVNNDISVRILMHIWAADGVHERLLGILLQGQ